MTSLFADLRFALRRLARAPGFVVTSVLLLGLALGTNACVFSVVYGLLYKPLPFANAAQLATITVHENQQGIDFGFSPPIFKEFSERPAPLKALAGYWPTQFGLVDDKTGQTTMLPAMRMQPLAFEMLGVRPALGRSLVDDDATTDLDGNILVSWEFAQAHFGSAENALGKKLPIQYLQPHPIVGVMPAGFHFVGEPQVWLPLKFSKDELSAPLLFGGLQAITQFATDTDTVATNEALTARIMDMPGIKDSPAEHGLAVRIAPLRKLWLGDRASALEMMQLAAALVMLVTLANLCNLFLARLSTRQHEMALLESLGADPWHRLRLVAIETFMVCSAGLLLGLAAYPAGLNLLRHFDLLPTDTPQPIAIDSVVFGFVVALAAFVAIALLLCAVGMREKGGKVYDALKQGSSRQTANRDAQRVRRGLIVAQIALTATLLIGTGLLLRSANRLLNENVGFDREHIVLAPVFYQPEKLNGAEDDKAYRAILLNLRERAAALPGVSVAGLSGNMPFDGSDWATTFVPPDAAADDPAARGSAKNYGNVGPNYFAAIGMPLIAGRTFSTDEIDNSAAVVIVDDFFAKRYFPAGDALGKTFQLQAGSPDEQKMRAVSIVGIVPTAKSRSLDEIIDRPTIYAPSPYASTIILHTRINPEILTHSLQSLLHEISPYAQLGNISTMSARIASTLDERTRLNRLLELLGAVALALAAIGLYAVLAYTVRTRTGEFGIRMALGATSQRVLGEVLSQGLRLIGLGLICGLPVAYLFAQLLSSQLYRTSALDPLTLFAVAALLAAIGLTACWWPARNASRVDPIRALRQE